MDTLTLSKIIDGYELHAKARRLSPHTLADYRNTFRKLIEHLGDVEFTQISRQDIEAFLVAQPVGKKTLLNYHTGLSALWTWACAEDLAPRHILHQVDPPRPERRAVLPYTEKDIKAMLDALAHSRPYRNHNTTTSHALPNAARNRAIILLLLDTGMRAEELVSLTLLDCDLKNQRLKIFGKGDKERLLPISSRTAQTIWKYLATRKDDRPSAPLFATENETPLDRHDLRKRLVEIGRRAGVSGVNVHRFRHTFAINYLRNGGDIYTLQMILGHATLEMCKRYLHLAQTDADEKHKIASPVMNWRL
jgi:site-specific recombinase XerD